MAIETKTFPNIPVSNWVRIREQFKKTIPGTITANYLASTLDMSEASAKGNIISSLRQVGLIDESGKTNQELAKKFRDDEQYREFCSDLLKKLYPSELLDAFPDKNSDLKKIKKWFMNHNGVGESGASRLAAFYLELLNGDPTSDKKSEIKNTKQSTTKPRVIIKNTKINSSQQSDQAGKSTPSPPKKDLNVHPDIHINIQIHISSDASPDQIKSIFENMSKYVYNNDNR